MRNAFFTGVLQGIVVASARDVCECTKGSKRNHSECDRIGMILLGS